MAEEIKLSSVVYKDVPFSSQFMEDGALIRNVNYEAVKKLVPQIERARGIKLENRGESHITVITPPEAQGWFAPSKKGINYFISWEEIHNKYFTVLQKTKFTIKCIGESSEGDKQVFFLVVDSPELRAIREEIQREVESRAKFTGRTDIIFDAAKYDPHITIGYVGGDVFSQPKTEEVACKKAEDLKLLITNK